MAAFSGVEGYGANATGGRGGKVLIVTNSNDSGVGSLRWALEDNTGPRTVVFAVNSVKLKSHIDLDRGDVTIAGQTAGGVEVSGAGIVIRDSNVIMRGMMVRPGDSRSGPDPDTRDALTLSAAYGPIKNIVIDHNSFSWGIDEVVHFWGAVSNVTFSNNMVAQALQDSLHSKGSHSMGMLVMASGRAQPDRLTISDNLFAFNEYRNPWIKHGTNVEVVNNLIIGAGDQAHVAALGDSAASYQNSPFSVKFMNNYYEAGAGVRRPELPYVGIRSSAANDAYFSGNLSYDAAGRPLDVEYRGSPAKSSPFSGSGVKLIDAADVYKSVLANAGANPAFREGADKRVIDMVVAGKNGLVDTVGQAGGYGGRKGFTAPSDRDKDGIPDEAERRMGTDPSVFDSNGDRNGDGYTNLENYINGLLPRGPVGAPPSASTSPPALESRSALESPPAPPPLPSQSGSTSATGTSLDKIVGVIRTDSSLASKVSGGEIDGGAAAAAGLNKMIVDGIRATGVGNDGSISVSDVYALNEWFRADGARIAAHAQFYGSTSGAESGYQLVAFEGANNRLHDVNTVDTLFGSIYRIGFEMNDANFGGPSGSRSVSAWQVRDYLSKLLATDLASGALKSGSSTTQPSTQSVATAQITQKTVETTRGGLDRILDVIENDRPLARNVDDQSIRTGVASARNLNDLIETGVASLGLMADERITMAEVAALNQWIRSDEERLDTFLFNHGRSVAGPDKGYEAVDGEGSGAQLFGWNAIDTVFGRIYDIGFAASSTHLRDAYSGKTTYMGDVAKWMTALLNNDGDFG